MTKQDEKIAPLERQLAELKAKVDPPKSDFKPMTDAEWIDEMHQMRERRMSMATPPSVIRDWNVLDENLCKGIREDRHAPTGRPGMIPSSQSTGGSEPRPSAGDGSGWGAARPLGPQPGIGWVDAQLIADEVRQRAELKRKLGE